MWYPEIHTEHEDILHKSYEQTNFGICSQVITTSQIKNRKKVIDFETLYRESKPTEIDRKKVSKHANQMERIVLLVLLFDFYF